MIRLLTLFFSSGLDVAIRLLAAYCQYTKRYFNSIFKKKQAANSWDPAARMYEDVIPSGDFNR
jgi:hypothetical protein